MLFLLAAFADLALWILHIAAIFVGHDAYLFLRAGKIMAEADANGEIWPDLITFVVSTVFLVWAIITYWARLDKVFSGLARKLVFAIGIVFVLRGSMFIFQLGGFTLVSDGEVPQLRDYVFSLAALGIGALHLGAVYFRR